MMTDLFTATFGQIPQLSETLTVSPPDILGNITISGLNGTVGTVTQGVFGESVLSMNGEEVATIQDSVYGNYEMVTDEGTFTAIDNVYGGENLLQFGEAVAVSRPGLFGTENWYESSTNELLATTGVNGFGQATITVPDHFDMTSFDGITGLDYLSMSSDMADISDVLTGSAEIFSLLDYI